MSDILPPAGLTGALTPGLVGLVGVPTAIGGKGMAGMGAGGAFAKLLHAPRAMPDEALANIEASTDDGAADDPLHPAVRHAAQWGPLAHAPGQAAPGAPEAVQVVDGGTSVSAGISAGNVEVRAAASLEELLPALVRNVAWSGDGTRGVVHLELGAGALSGARVVIEADGGRVRVSVTGPASVHAAVDLEAWRDRIAARLAARGLEASSVEIV